MNKEKKINRKNIILLTIDCLRADHLHHLGYKKNTSPTFDWLAKEGITFSKAYSNAPYTNYSVPSFLTSRIPPIGKDFRETITTVLKKYGYSAASFNPNPIVLDPKLTAGGRIDKGFDVFDLMLSTRKKLGIGIQVMRQWRMKDIRQNLNKEGYLYKTIFSIYDKMIKTFPTALCPKDHLIIPKAEEINKKALEWIKKQEGHFFLWIHYMDVHEPYAAPDYPDKKEMLYLMTKYRDFPNMLSKDEIKKLMNLYDLCIKYVDSCIHDMIEELKEMNIFDNCAIIVSADHGDAFAEHDGALGHGGKFVEQLYEEAINVPFIVYGDKRKDVKTDKLIHLLDLAPTICDIADIPPQPYFLGKSVFGPSENKGIVINAIAAIAYRTEKHKLIINKQGKKGTELYDLIKDPKETDNIYNKNKELATKLESEMVSILSNYKRRQKLIDFKVKT